MDKENESIIYIPKYGYLALANAVLAFALSISFWVFKAENDEWFIVFVIGWAVIGLLWVWRTLTTIPQKNHVSFFGDSMVVKRIWHMEQRIFYTDIVDQTYVRKWLRKHLKIKTKTTMYDFVLPFVKLDLVHEHLLQERLAKREQKTYET